ncbi:WxL domain-containing protein [Lacticaseibacillus salsurivasis]|uniref:WxL domain-containing protein n=1 Tax=Lacticaseibacillus salsurivasis TaxID=3081441 RepID=UPI0030C69919
MKKATWIFSSVIAALLATGAPSVVSAAGAPGGPGIDGNNLTTASDGFTLTADGTDTAVEADSTAQVVVPAGSLSLTKVPDLNFGTVEVKDLIDGPKSLNLNTDKIALAKTTFDGNDKQTIQVLDYRGSNAGWTLNAQLSAFSNSKGNSISVDSLELNGATSGNGIVGQLLQTNIAKQGGAVLVASKDNGTGETTVVLDGNTKLQLPDQNTAIAGDYQAKITWTLSAVAYTPAP